MLWWSLLTFLVLVGIFQRWKKSFLIKERSALVDASLCLPLVWEPSLGMSSPKLPLVKV